MFKTILDWIAGSKQQDAINRKTDIDLDRLWECIDKINNNKVLQRREGTTTSLLILMINLGELVKKENFFFITDNMQLTKHCLENFLRLLDEVGFTNYKVNRREHKVVFFKRDVSIFFKTYHSNLRGYKCDRLFFDVTNSNILNEAADKIKNELLLSNDVITYNFMGG